MNIFMKRQTVILWIAILALVLALAGLAYLGIFTRFMADDFCVAGEAHNLSLGGMLALWYAEWDGRYTYIVVSTLIIAAGPKFAGWMPALTAVIWLLGGTWALLPLLRRDRWSKPGLPAFLLSAIALLTLLSSTPNLYQSFFWHSSMVTYSLPLVGLVFSAGIILRVWLEDARILPSSAALFLLTFLLSGFSELVSTMQPVLFLLLLFLTFFIKDKTTRKRLLILFGSALLAALISLAVVFLAPGNQVRLVAAGTISTRPGLLRIITFSLRNMAHIVGKYFIWTPLWALLSILPPFLLGWLFSKSADGVSPVRGFGEFGRQAWVRGVVLVVVFALALVWAACTPVVYGLNAYPDDRVIIIPQYVVVVAAVIASTLLGAGLRKSGSLPDPALRKWMAPALLVVILLVVLSAAGLSLLQTSAQVPLYRTFAQSWDERSQFIQEAARSGETEVTVPGGSSMFGVGNLNIDPDNWINKCMASYYQVERIIGR